MTGIVILAAGSSTRMGKPKQNLPYKNRTLLQTAVNTALAANCCTVAVILGANFSSVASTIVDKPIHIIENENWEDGMGSSISHGLSEVLKILPAISSALFMLTDQPFVTSELISNMMSKAEPAKIIACSYNDTMGPPVLFDRIFFDELLFMKGNEGAKKILQKHAGAIVPIPFHLGEFDIDTPEDYERLQDMD